MNQPLRTIYSESLSMGDIGTWANCATVLRTVIGLLLFSFAALHKSVEWNIIGLVTHFMLDTLDGYLARYFKQETRLGAQIDILADRILIALFCFNLILTRPPLLMVIVLFLFELMGLDQFLSNQFIRWPISSPNYFYLIDRRVWLLNWSPAGKVLNSGPVTILGSGPVMGRWATGGLPARSDGSFLERNFFKELQPWIYLLAIAAIGVVPTMVKQVLKLNSSWRAGIAVRGGSNA